MHRPGITASFLTLIAAGCGGSSSGGGDMGSQYPCSPTSACTATAGATCLNTANNQGQSTFGLRMTQVNFTAPAQFTTGVISALFPSYIEPSQAACGLTGDAYFNWLLQFNTTANTLVTGGAPPVSSAAAGYSFANASISGTQVAPVTFPVTISASGQFSTSTTQTVAMPVYLDSSGTNALVLPLRDLTFSNGQLSSDHNCIGSYNAQGLQVSNSCKPDSTHPLFLSGGQVSAVISLADADAIQVTALAQSLCAVLSGAPDANGKCMRDANGNITYKGSWCVATNMAATANCADAVQLAATFAASGVKIN